MRVLADSGFYRRRRGQPTTHRAPLPRRVTADATTTTVRTMRSASQWIPLLLALTATSTGASAQAQVGGAKVTVRIADTAGNALPAGAEVQARIAWFGNLPSGIEAPLQPVTVDADGTIAVPARWATPGRTDSWVHVERTAADGRRERAFAPLPLATDGLRLQPEELLASGTLQDEQGVKVSAWLARIDVVGGEAADGPRLRERLGARWVQTEGPWELHGWRTDGALSLRAFYLHHGPAAAEVPLVFGKQDIAITLPATGVLQVRVGNPERFPERALFAVVRDLDRGGAPLRHFLIPNNATNIRLRTGRHAVTCELSGAVVADFGTIALAHQATNEQTVDLRSVRTFVIEVVDPDGKPIPAARVRVVGCPDEPQARQRIPTAGDYRHQFVVATTATSVDLEVSDFGGAPIRVDGVAADRTVVLAPQAR